MTILLGLTLHITFGIDLIHYSYDLPFKPRPPISVDEAVIIYMDEESHKELNQPFNAPWDRSLHAKLLERLTRDHARGVIFDIVFSDPGPDRRADESFASAIKKNGRVILAADMAPVAYGVDLVEARRVIPLYDPFAQAAAAIGLDEVVPDPDLVVRRHFHGSPDDPLPSMSWAAAELLGADLTKQPERFRPPWVNYYGPPKTIPSVNYYQALDTNAVAGGFFSNKVVFVGARLLTRFSGQRKDEYLTPYSSWAGQIPGHKKVEPFMPGVEVQATLFLNLVRRDWLTRSSFATERIFMIGLLGLLSGWGLVQLRPLKSTVLALVAVVALVLTAYLAFVYARFWFPWLILLVQILAAWTWSVGFNFYQLHLQKKLLEHSLALHLPPKRIKQLVNHPELLKPGAEKQMLSIMFTDIEDFTKLSEGMDSDDLARLMNEYFETIIPCIHQAEGTVMKLIGDAILAVWNAPDPQPNHRELACRAAIFLKDQTVHFTGNQAGLKLRTRIGIHTGLADVGNFGNTARIDYTVIGENVNLASRLEGLNKYLGTDILTTHQTFEGCSDQIASRSAGHFRLKGFEKVVEVHQVIGLRDHVAESKAWRETFEQALREFQRKDFDAAETGFCRTLKLRPGDGPARFYLHQIAELRAHPPAPDWAGVIELKDK
jgi:adenylate cyclase